MTAATMRRGGARLRGGSEVLYESVYYLPIYLVDDKWRTSTGECSLFVRLFRLVRTPKGNLRLHIANDVWGFPSTEAMVRAIERAEIRPLPREAQDDQLYVPRGLRRHHAEVSKSFERIPEPSDD